MLWSGSDSRGKYSCARQSREACFSKVPRTFRARKASCQTAIRLFSKADLLTRF